jgi:hypothetical protein
MFLSTKQYTSSELSHKLIMRVNKYQNNNNYNNYSFNIFTENRKTLFKERWQVIEKNGHMVSKRMMWFAPNYWEYVHLAESCNKAMAQSDDED